MNFVHIRKVDNTKAELQPWTTKQPDEDVTALFENADKDPAIAKLRGDPAARRHYFANQSHRQATKLGPKVCHRSCCLDALVIVIFDLRSIDRDFCRLLQRLHQLFQPLSQNPYC